MSEIQAVRLTQENFEEVAQWAGVQEYWGLSAPVPALHMETPEGLMLAHLGDWVIRGPRGEFYPRKADAYQRAI